MVSVWHAEWWDGSDLSVLYIFVAFFTTSNRRLFGFVGRLMRVGVTCEWWGEFPARVPCRNLVLVHSTIFPAVNRVYGSPWRVASLAGLPVSSSLAASLTHSGFTFSRPNH